MSSSPFKKHDKPNIRVGILGCGAIGSRIAKSIKTECDHEAVVSALFDINPAKAENLQKQIPQKNIVKKSYRDLLAHSDLVVEAVNAPDTRRLVRLTIDEHKDTEQLLDMLLAKKRASDRKHWLETKGDLATL